MIEYIEKNEVVDRCGIIGRKRKADSNSQDYEFGQNSRATNDLSLIRV